MEIELNSFTVFGYRGVYRDGSLENTTLVSLLTTEDIKKTVEQMDYWQRMPVVAIAKGNLVTRISCKQEKLEYKKFREAIVEELNKYNEPFYAFYGNCYQNILHKMTNRKFSFVDLQTICDQNKDDIGNYGVKYTFSNRIGAKKLLGLSVEQSMDIKGKKAIKHLNEFLKSNKQEDFEYLLWFVTNALADDAAILRELLNRHWLFINNKYENENTA